MFQGTTQTINTSDVIRFTIKETGQQFELSVKVVNGQSTIVLNSGFVPLEVDSESVYGGNRIEVHIDPDA